MYSSQGDLVAEWIGSRTSSGKLQMTHGGLELRSEGSGMSVHETVHHLAEANIVAAGMMIAAIGKDGSTFDWSWLFPNMEWTKRMGYAKAPIEPAVDLIDALCRQIANLVTINPEILDRKVTLFDTPGGETYTKTVAEIMQMEIDHAAEHLGDFKSMSEPAGGQIAPTSDQSLEGLSVGQRELQI